MNFMVIIFFFIFGILSIVFFKRKTSKMYRMNEIVNQEEVPEKSNREFYATLLEILAAILTII
ncbi:hypothetical protein [Flavobacterium sp.]|uniref:hypothetical protein n=1 Tax=Flavobacterium sp. TaxID=239 RepID=UPI0039E4AE03